MADPTRIIVADDHPIVRAGVRLLVESRPGWELVGEAGSGVEVLRQVEELHPDVLVLDLWLGDDDGIETLRELRRRKAAVRILVYSMNDELLHGPRAIQAGADGYLVKNRGLEELSRAIEAIASGKRYLGEGLSEAMIDASLAGSRNRHGDASTALQCLTGREIQVLRLIGRGMATGEIAQALGVSPKTIGAHRENLKNKLGAGSAQELVRLAVNYLENHAI